MNNCLVYKMSKEIWNEKSSWQFPRAQGLQTASFIQPAVQDPKTLSFTIINDKEKQQILTFQKLEPANVWHFCFK